MPVLLEMIQAADQNCRDNAGRDRILAQQEAEVQDFQRLSVEADRIKHDPEGVVVTLEVAIGCNEYKEEQAFRARHGNQPIRFAASQRRFI